MEALMDENTWQLLTQRLDNQDTATANLRTEVIGMLKEIRTETKATNGSVGRVMERVSALEAINIKDAADKMQAALDRVAALEAVNDGEAEEESKRFEKHVQRMNWLVGLAMACAGGAVGYVGHALGVW